MSGPRDKIRKRMQVFRSPAVLKGIHAALFEAADLVKAEAQHSITRGSVSGKGHVPSAPGEPPMNDTGVLKDGIQTRQQPFKPGKVLSASVVSLAPYSGALEFGTSKMAARPFMRAARDKMKGEAERLVVSRINTIIRRNRK